MAAKPKLTPEQWAEVKKTWENDSRDGYAWLIKELDSPVSGPAVRKVAILEKWTKKPSKQSKKTDSKSSNKKQSNKVSKVSRKVSENPKTMVSETITKTLTKDGDGNKVGRPTKYRDEYAEQAYKLCLMGYTDKKLADFFDVAESTINEWKLDHHEFSESLSRGKDIADAEVAFKFYRRACGYRYTETKTTKVICENGQELIAEIIEHKKEIPADVGAGKVWLSNRQPKYWRDSNNSKVKVQFDTEKLNEIAENFTKAMKRSKERQMAVLRERGILIDNDTGRPVDG